MSKSINNFDYTEADEIVKMLDFEQQEVQNKVEHTAAIEGKTFCLTGKLSRKREEIKSEIESLGGRVVGTISSKVDYLITNTPDSGTQKNKDAQNLGIKIITEEEYNSYKNN